jgi:NADH dehydrogenase FAD-containing subunit
LLPSATSGALGFRDIVEPLRSTSELSFHHSWAEDVDFNSQTITCVPASSPAFRAKDPLVKEQQRDARAETPERLKATYKIKYDKLVIAAGSYNQTFGTPGVEKNAL